MNICEYYMSFNVYYVPIFIKQQIFKIFKLQTKIDEKKRYNITLHKKKNIFLKLIYNFKDNKIFMTEH